MSQCQICKEYLATNNNYRYCIYCGTRLVANKPLEQVKIEKEVIAMADVTKLKMSLNKIKDRSSKEAKSIRKQLRDAGYSIRANKGKLTGAKKSIAKKTKTAKAEHPAVA